MAELGVAFDNRTGQGWSAVVSALDAGQYVELQGDSDRFSDATCSGEFDGDHAIGVHPAFRVVSGRRQRWIDDPICPTGRWEYESVLHAYASKLIPSIGFGVFTVPVPKVPTPVPPKPVDLYKGATKLVPKRIKKVAVARGRFAVGRRRPKKAGAVLHPLANGKTFTAYQVTKNGQRLAGSSTWFGDRTGTLWYHSSSF
jgi:hypothetical protein